MLYDQELLQERRKMYTDLYTGIIPKRVPISVGLATEISIENAGLPLAQTQWTAEGLEDAIENVVKNIKSDTFPSDVARSPQYAELSGDKFWNMGKSGIMQHPEHIYMQPEEYDDFTHSPYDYILEKLLPRRLTKLDESNSIKSALVLFKAITAMNNTRATMGMIQGKLAAKYSFFSVPFEQSGFTVAPFDFIANCLRGFTGMMSDIKRCPEKVSEACEALLPLLLKFGLPKVQTNIGAIFMPCHMPTFMRPAEFEKMYYPTFSKLIHAAAEKGQTFSLFCEDNWMRYLDYLQDLPQGTRFQFEYGDPKLAKEKLGKDHIITGFYPSGMFKTHTKQQCIDKAKELLDILAPGGNYYFNFDKAPLTLGSTNLENYYAVVEYVAENSTYENAGERAFVSDRESTIKHVLKDIPVFTSKYYQTKEDYMQNNSYPIEEIKPIIASITEGYETMTLKTIMGLL